METQQKNNEKTERYLTYIETGEITKIFWEKMDEIRDIKFIPGDEIEITINFKLK